MPRVRRSLRSQILASMEPSIGYNVGEVMSVLRDNTQILEAVNSELHTLVELGELRKGVRGVSVVYTLA